MLEKPDIAEDLIISCLQKEYALRVRDLNFLPIGADVNSAVYRVVTEDEIAYFLKLRMDFDEIIVRVPLFLRGEGIREIIVPFESESKQRWADFGNYKLILYPFIEGKNGFEVELSDPQRRRLGNAFRAIHQARVPPDLKRLIPKESFSPFWRQRMSSFQSQAEKGHFDDLIAAKLTQFMQAKQSDITRLIQRAEELAAELQSQPMKLVLCHSDIHGGNMLLTEQDALYIVDWDNPILAPKERDLMFIGGGIDENWKTEREESVFYEGYGKTAIDLKALAYYRYERVIEDLAAFCEQVLLIDGSSADREQAYRWFISNFEPGWTIEIAEKTYLLSL